MRRTDVRNGERFRTLIVGGLVISLTMGISASAISYERPGPPVERVSVNSDGSNIEESGLDSVLRDYTVNTWGVMSANARYVVFQVSWELYRKDLTTGELEPVSTITHDGLPPVDQCIPDPWAYDNRFPRNRGSRNPSISADGRFVVFSSCVQNLVPDDTNLARDVFVRDMVLGVTQRVSVASGGEGHPLPAVGLFSELNRYQAISDDGRYVVFTSTADLSGGDDPPPAFASMPNLYLHDRETVTTEPILPGVADPLLSVCNLVGICNADLIGTCGMDMIPGGGISGDGRYVVFTSNRNDLVPEAYGPGDRSSNAFVYDRSRKTFEIASTASDGSRTHQLVTGNACAGVDVTISRDGRYVAFRSMDAALVPNDDTPKMADVFVKDRETGRTERVSVESQGPPQKGIWRSWISRDGRYVVFQNNYHGYHIVRHDRMTGAAVKNLFRSNYPEKYQERPMTADGRYVVAETHGPLTPDDTNNTWDVYLRDTGPPLGAQVDRVKATSGSPAEVEVGGWATFDGQVMATKADPDDDGEIGAHEQGAEILGGEFVYRPEEEDFFFRLELTRIPPKLLGLGGVHTAGDVRTLYVLTFTVEDVPYQIRIHKLRVPPTDPTDPLAHAFGLFRCTNEVTCTEVAPLEGGYGTTGERMVVSLPLEVLREDGTNVQEGSQIGGLNAYTADGQYLTGVARILDHVRLIDVPEVEVPKAGVWVTVGTGDEAKTVQADLQEGRFSVRFPASLFADLPTVVTTKACLGEECATQGHQVSKLD